MAKTQGPLFSLSAHGTFGKSLTFQRRAGTHAVFLPKTPYDPKSERQLSIRDYIKAGVDYWHDIGAVYQAEWNSFVN